MDSLHRSDTASPFVPLSPAVTGLALAMFWAAAVGTGIVAVLNYRPTVVGVYASFLLYLTVMSLPLAVLPTRWGVFHPLVFFVLWRGAMELFRTDVLLGSGSFTFHRALPGFSQTELDRIVVKNFALETLALVGLYAGYSVIPYLRVRTLRNPAARAVRLKVAIWVGLSTVAVLVLARAAGGVKALLLQRGIPVAERVATSIGAHWHMLAGIGAIAPILWMAFRPRAVRTASFWVLTSTSLALVFIARGSRSAVILPLILLGTVHALRSRRIPYKALALAALAALVILGVLGNFRRASQHVDDFDDIDLVGVNEGFTSGVEEIAARGTSTNGQLAVVARVPDRVGYLFGRSYLAIPPIILPRALFGEKPPAAGKLNAQLIHERMGTSIPAGSVGEAFWNFSYVGPLLVFFAYGVILKICAGTFLQNARNPVVIVGYAYTLVLLVPSSDAAYDFVQALIPAVAFGVFLVLGLPMGGRRARLRHSGAAPRADGAYRRLPVPAGDGRLPDAVQGEIPG